MLVLAVLTKPYNISVNMVQTHTGINIEYEWYVTGSPRLLVMVTCLEGVEANYSVCEEYSFGTARRAEGADSWGVLGWMDAPFPYGLYNVTITSSVGWFGLSESASFYIAKPLFDSKNPSFCLIEFQFI